MDETDRERWRGSVDSNIQNLRENVRTLFRLSDVGEKDRQRLEVLITALTGSVNALAIKVGLISGVGAIVGSAVMQYVLSLLKH